MNREQVTNEAIRAACSAFDLCGSMQSAVKDTFADYDMPVSMDEIGQILIAANNRIRAESPSGKWVRDDSGRSRRVG